MYKITLLEKDIKISNPERFMWTQTKQNYERHVEQMENQNDIVEEKNWASVCERVCRRIERASQ